jgi:flagellar motor component MotA
LVSGILFILIRFVLINGSHPAVLYDLPSLLFVVVCPFITMYILHGHTAIKTAFSAPFKKNISTETLVMANGYFKKYNIVTWLWAFAAALIGVIGILQNLDNKLAIGPNLVLAIFSILYAIVIHVFVILPFTILINKKIREMA